MTGEEQQQLFRIERKIDNYFGWLVFLIFLGVFLINFSISHHVIKNQQQNLIENRAKQIMSEEKDETVNKALEYVVWGEKQE